MFLFSCIISIWYLVCVLQVTTTTPIEFCASSLRPAMSSYGRYNSQSQPYAPSAPELPPPSSNYTPPNNYTQTSPPSSNYTQGYGYGQFSSSGYSNFPPGTNPDIITSFQMVDTDRSGFIDDRELQRALSSSFHSFNLRTIRLLMFLFKHPNESLRIGNLHFFPNSLNFFFRYFIHFNF